MKLNGLILLFSVLSTLSYAQDSLLFSRNSIRYFNGYREVEAGTSTGSFSYIKLNDFDLVPSADVTQQLQGRVSGLYVSNSSLPGQPAGAYFRGPAYFSKIHYGPDHGLIPTYQPLQGKDDLKLREFWKNYNNIMYIVDGIPLNDISVISPYDIQTLVVLKDPASLALYGASAYHGVILVSTQSSESSKKFTLSYDSYYGVQFPGEGQQDLLNPYELADLYWLAHKNANIPPDSEQFGNGPAPVIPDYIFPAGKMEGDPAVDPALYDRDNYPITHANKSGTNWYKEATRVAPLQHHNIRASFSGSKFKSATSVDYYKQDGILLNNYFERITLHENYDWKIHKKINLNGSLHYARRNFPNVVDGNEMMDEIYSIDPMIPVLDISGNWAGTVAPELGFGSNPVATLNRAENNESYSNDFLSNTALIWEIGAGISLSTNYIVSSYGTWKREYFPGTYENRYNGIMSSERSDLSELSRIWNQMLTFRRAFKRSEITIFAGHRFAHQDELFSYNWEQGANYSSYANKSEDVRPVWFGSIDYGYAERFLFTFSMCGLSKDVFTTAAATTSWNIHREKFMKNSGFSSLRLTMGYGSIGSESYYRMAMYPNPLEVRYVAIRSAVLGLNGTFLRDHMNFGIEYYRQTEEEWSRTNGLEIDLGGHGKIAKGLKYNWGLTFSHYTNTVNERLLDANLDYYSKDEPYGAFHGYQTNGIFQSQSDIDSYPPMGGRVGSFRHSDMNNDNLITYDGDRVIIGNPNPDFTYGFDFGFQFKSFRLSGQFYGAVGFDIKNETKYSLDYSYGGTAKSSRALYDSWSVDRPDGTTEMAGPSFRTENSYFIEKGSYMKLKSLKLEYSFSSKILSRLNADRFTLYVQGNNLLTSTSYSGIDPEINSTVQMPLSSGQTPTPISSFGADNWKYPNVRMVMLGISLMF